MQSLIRSKSAGVTGGRGTAGAGPGRDLLYGSRGVPAARTYRRPGDLGPYEPCPSMPGCVLWTRWRPRRRLEPEKSRDAQEHGELRKLKPEEKYDVREEEDLTWRTWSPCVSVAAVRHAISAPPRRTLRRHAIQAAVEDGPGATGSAGHPSPRQGTPGLWIRTLARSGCGTPRGTPRAIGQPMSNLRSRRRWPDRPQGRTRLQNPAWSMTPMVGEARQSQNGACGPAHGANAG